MKQLWVMALFVGVMSAGCAGRLDAVEVRPDNAVAVMPASEKAAMVEYIRVDGQACLQPKVIAGNPEDADLVRAQHQWLAKTYPGYRLVRQSHVLTLAPEFRPPGHENDQAPGEHDSIEFESADGKPITECFSLKVPQSEADD
jgi:hypothetical protein